MILYCKVEVVIAILTITAESHVHKLCNFCSVV